MQPKTKREGENGRETGTFILGFGEWLVEFKYIPAKLPLNPHG
jgi:hypothetical protein